jgi:S1-C subfamily serine protease
LAGHYDSTFEFRTRIENGTIQSKIYKMKQVSTLLFFFTLLFSTQILAQSHHSNSAFLGVESDEINTEKARILGLDNPHGIIIEKVVKNSAADRAGLQPFDYLYRINDREFTEDHGLTQALRAQKSGDEVVLYFIRKGNSKSQKVSLGGQNDRNQGYTSDRNSGKRAFLGVSHVAYTNSGVVVNITNNSTAEELGMEDGDILTFINGYRIVDWGDITTALRTISTGDEVVINYISDGQKRRGSGNIGSNPNRHNHYGNHNDRGEIFEEKMERFGESMEELGEEIEENAEEWAEKFGDNFGDAISEIFEGDRDNNRRLNNNSAFLGINSHRPSAEKARFLNFENRYGSYIENVIENTAAKNAGLQAFDYVYGIDEYRTGENQSLGTILHKYQSDDNAEVLFIRSGKKQRNAIKFIPKSEARFSNIDECDEAFLGVRNVPNHTRSKGNVAVNPIENSTANLMGILKGDIIKEINGYPVFDWSDVATGVDAMKPGEKIKVSLSRNGEGRVLSGTIKSKRETNGSSRCNEGSDNDNEDFNFNFDFDIDENDDDNVRISRSPSDEERRNIDDMEVVVEDLTGADADNMRAKYGVDMPVVSDLQVTQVTLFPNPSMGMFTLKFNLPQNGDTAIRIFNNLGREIYNYELSGFSGEFEDNIDISQNGAGSYFLAITQNGKTMTKKIILQKR